MNLIVYSKTRNEIGQRLQHAIESVIPEDGVQFFQSVDGLRRRLRRPGNNLSGAVLLALSRQELSELLSVREFLGDIRVILILPDRESATVSKGHLFRPRFMTYADEEFENVKTVVMKIMQISTMRPYLESGRQGTISRTLQLWRGG